MKIWLGTGGSPESTLRAVELGLPVFYGVLGGSPQHWSQYTDLHRPGWVQKGRDVRTAEIAVAGHGFVAANSQEAKSFYGDYEYVMYDEGMRNLGRTPPPRSSLAKNYEKGGMVFVGSPAEIADHILDLHQHLGHSVQIIQMDVGGMPQNEFLKAIELLGTEVFPAAKAGLGAADK